MAEAMRNDMIRKYSEMDIDELLSQLNENELEQLSGMVDPDDPLIPPSERCKNQTDKAPTGPLNRRKLLSYLEQYAKEQEDWPEFKPFEAGVKRGKVWVAPKVAEPKESIGEISVELDLEDDAKTALESATPAELVDLAAILGLHSMLSQDQYHASIENKGQAAGATFESLVKASMPKPVPLLPENATDTSKTAQKVYNDDDDIVELNWNNIRTVKREDFRVLFDGLKRNTNLRSLSLANVNLTDSTAELLVEALKENKSLRILNVESNYISGNMLKNIIEAALANNIITEIRAANQRPSILGNKIEMEIARLVDENRSLLSIGLELAVADARVRVSRKLQENRDRLRRLRVGQEIE
ncbi:tropomodulin-like isoform X2 [Varroa jacobsoni]|nr:tropomodulin-like isoform X2 [Varroa destructor]XP_022653153.1 tropomodulin-like isoform X2 [Varroa destructor]XP_022705929.1 tropomodulin-like isoform X2 [Varroa jacobsoni]XP_022705937.1 tropomodulin-like isoform X2 [Varroa jacobsoni]XP_022705946.1 tropomodulin-like isoform X2 [Varroa jacobsoni]